MEVSIERVQGVTHRLVPEISQLLETTFPDCERESIPDFLADLEANRGPSLWVMTSHDGYLIGFARGFVFQASRRGFVVHIALVPESRGKRLGEQLLKRVNEEMRTSCEGYEGMYLEVERLEDAVTDAERESRRKRLAFFDRLGARLVSSELIQPPSQPGQPPVPLNLLFWGETAARDDELLSDFYKGIATIYRKF